MRGADEQTGALFSYLSPDAMVPKDHPLRAIRPLVNAALARLSPNFEGLYAPTGRASIAPEKLLRALLLQAFYTVRSERQDLVAWVSSLGTSNPTHGPGHAMRTYSGRPRSSMRFSTSAAIATSVACRSFVCERNPSPMTRFHRDASDSTRATHLG